MRLPIALAATLGLASAALAGEVAPGDVKIVEGMIEQPLTDKPGDPEAGIDAFTGRKAGNCLACHQVTSLLGAFQFHGEVGPPLDGVADVYTAAELRARIVNPKTESARDNHAVLLPRRRAQPFG